MTGDFFGGLFDFNGDGFTSPDEAAAAFLIMEEMDREAADDGDDEDDEDE